MDDFEKNRLQEQVRDLFSKIVRRADHSKELIQLSYLRKDLKELERKLKQLGIEL